MHLLLAQIPGIPLFPEQASEHARQVDHVFFFILLITGGIALLVTTLLIGFAIRYRRRSGSGPTPRITGWLALEWAWTLAPIGFFAAMYLWGLSVYSNNFRPPPDAYEVFVVGKQWMWKVQHLGGQREINELHIPVGRPVKITLISEDVIHDFGIPAFRVKVDVLPGRYVSTWYLPTKIGKFHLFCNQYCGTGHSRMIGTVTVLSPEDYESWLRQKAEGSPALEGRKLFLKLQCLSCHSADADARAPVLEGIYNKSVPLREGKTTVANREYIRESIVEPRKKIVAGWQPIMPTFRGQVTEEELLQLIAYIQSLRPGDTPTRTEASPAPIGTPSSGATGEAAPR